jgi:hypothetical protein
MATVGSRRLGRIAMLGALSAVMMLVGPLVTSSQAAPPPPAPVVSGATVHFVKNDNSFIALQTAPCTGCKLVAAARFGASAAYPTSPHGTGVQALVVRGTKVILLRDRTTFRLSVWQVEGGVRSATPAHLSVKVGEFLAQLQTKDSAQARGAHSLTVTYALQGGSIESDLTKVEIFAARGQTPPGTPTTPPDGMPSWSCVPPHCPHAVYPSVPVRGLESGHTYSISVYGLDGHGHVARGTTKGFVMGLGSYVGSTELSSNDAVAPGSLAVDRDGGTHEFLFAGLTHSDLGHLVYLTRRPGASGFTTTKVHGAKGADTALIAPTVSGNGMDVVMASCSAVDVIQVPSTAMTLPAFTAKDQAVTQHRCLGEDGENKSPDLVGMVALAHNGLALLFDNDPTHPGSADAQTVYIGSPGHHFHKTVIPGSTNTTSGGFIARDASNGKVYVANTGSAAHAIDVWTLGPVPHTSWSQPVRAAERQAGESVSSLAATNGQLFLGVYRHNQAARNGAYVGHRSAAGRWSALARLPHSSKLAKGNLLAANPGSTSVWQLDTIDRHHGTRANSGLEERHFTAGHGWSRPVRLTHWAGDFLDNLVAGWQGGATYDHTLF